MLILLLAILVAGTVACGATAHTQFDKNITESDTFRSVLGFDLRDDSHISAGISISGDAGMDSKPRFIVLPIETRSAESIRELWTTWASYEKCCTVLSYVGSLAAGKQVIRLDPIIVRKPSSDEIVAESEGTYLLVYGLERTFIYNYPDSRRPRDYAKLKTNLQSDEIQAIALALPKGSGREIVPGKTETPEHIAENSLSRFYPAMREEAGEDRLVVAYNVELNETTKFWLGVLTALFVVAASQSATFFFLPDHSHPFLRRLFIFACILITLSALIVVAILAISHWDEDTRGALVTILTSSLTAVLGGVALYLKSKSVGNTQTLSRQQGRGTPRGYPRRR